MESNETRFGKDVENTVEDHFTIWSDDIASVSESPSNRVEEPKEAEDACGYDVAFVAVLAESTSSTSSGADKDPENVEHGNAAEGEETKLVARLDESADQTGFDHNKIHEDRKEDF